MATISAALDAQNTRTESPKYFAKFGSFQKILHNKENFYQSRSRTAKFSVQGRGVEMNYRTYTKWFSIETLSEEF